MREGVPGMGAGDGVKLCGDQESWGRSSRRGTG